MARGIHWDQRERSLKPLGKFARQIDRDADRVTALGVLASKDWITQINHNAQNTGRRQRGRKFASGKGRGQTGHDKNPESQAGKAAAHQIETGSAILVHSFVSFKVHGIRLMVNLRAPGNPHLRAQNLLQLPVF
jgi:hypothetical protein